MSERRQSKSGRGQSVLAMIKDHAAEGVIHAVINVIAKLPSADGLAYDLGNRCGGGSDQKATRFSKDFDRLGKQTVQFGVDHFSQSSEGRDCGVVVGREATADVQEFEIKATSLGFVEDARGQLQRLSVVLRIGALAADVEAQSFDLKLIIMRESDQ